MFSLVFAGEESAAPLAHTAMRMMGGSKRAQTVRGC
jgi:hypothetical protein